MKTDVAARTVAIVAGFLAVLVMFGANGHTDAEKRNVLLYGYEAEAINLPQIAADVDKALGDENLKGVAAKTTDANTLLGLTILAKGQAQEEIGAMAIKAQGANGPIVALARIIIGGANEASVSAFIKADPDNALGYYLKMRLLIEAGNKTSEAFDTLKKGASCERFATYDEGVAGSVKAALDALGLRGAARLRAWGLVVMAEMKFYYEYAGFIIGSLSKETARLDAARRNEAADELLIMGGHLSTGSFAARYPACEALVSAFRIKAESAAAANSALARVYIMAAQAIASVERSFPGKEDGAKLFRTAERLPAVITVSFIIEKEIDTLAARSLKVAQENRAAFDKAKAKIIASAGRVVTCAADDPDGLFIPYLYPYETAEGKQGIWGTTYITVLAMINGKPELVKADDELYAAVNALESITGEVPDAANRTNLKQIGLGIGMYTADYNKRPDSLDVLFKDGYLPAPLKNASAITGKPYVYLGAGTTESKTTGEDAKVVLAYDEYKSPDGKQDVLFGDYHVAVVPSAELDGLLKAQAKK